MIIDAIKSVLINHIKIMEFIKSEFTEDNTHNIEFTFSTNKLLENRLSIQVCDNENLYGDLYNKICEVKNSIDKQRTSKMWDKAKRKMNPYELIHIAGSNYLINEKKEIIRDTDIYCPLSRAFFKMVEIYDTWDIIPDKYKNNPGFIACLAEGPGGFVEALYKKRLKARGLNDVIHAITLDSKNRNIPGWSQLKRRKKHILNSSDVNFHTGDLYNYNSTVEFSKNFFETKAFLVTCDGGFDYSKDFNNQEKSFFRLIFCEITCALHIQEKGGTFVLKIFDLFTNLSVQLIYLLTTLYENVSIVKPKTSRPANSEKYIIAKGFKGIPLNILQSMIHIIKKWKNITKIKQKNISLNIKIPNTFYTHMYKLNEFFVKRQTYFINLTLNYIKNNKKKVDRQDNILKVEQENIAIKWFTEHCIITKIYIKKNKKYINN